MKRFQGLVSTALAYSAAHHWMDKDPQMRQVWGWFALSAIALLVVTGLISHWNNARAKTQKPTVQN